MFNNFNNLLELMEEDYTSLDLAAALPYLIGGTAGGWLGGRWFRGVRVLWLRRAFGLLLLYGGARCLL